MMISSQNIYNKFVDLHIEYDSAKISVRVYPYEAENIIYELFNVIIDINKMLCDGDDRKSLFESLLDDNLSKWEISQLFQKDDENPENSEN
jgi:hypothetical protein